MMLGQLMNQALGGQEQFVADIAARDLRLAARLADASASQGLSPSGYVEKAVRSFLHDDDDEAWTTVTGALQSATDPGNGFLLAVVRRRLRMDGL